ncbi:MAG: TonB-dependent receptor plug domain-containing protein, partial [Dokdonella sp.]|nr:TonB-dependent receptor plug domain-containing protein [Dokdonella sp.]
MGIGRLCRAARERRRSVRLPVCIRVSRLLDPIHSAVVGSCGVMQRRARSETTGRGPERKVLWMRIILGSIRALFSRDLPMSMFKLRHPPIRSPLAVALLLALAVPAISHAEPEAQTLDTVRVQGNAAPKHATDARSATRTDTPLRDVPAAISAVTAIELEERNVHSLNQALETVPGVSLTMGEGRRDQVNIRGFSAMFDQYLDGFRDDTPYYRDLADIERVEVLRGPASVLYGRGSGGGIINRITKQPVFGGDIGRTTLSLGAYDALRGTLDVGHGSDAFAWRFNAAAEQA